MSANDNATINVGTIEGTARALPRRLRRVWPRTAQRRADSGAEETTWDDKC
jgi:hypothetical protein